MSTLRVQMLKLQIAPLIHSWPEQTPEPPEIHQWLCHPDSKCADGCADTPIPERLEAYRLAHDEEEERICKALFKA